LNTVEKNGKLYYKFKILRNSRLRSSILQDSISEIGKIKEHAREVDLNADRKRLWLGKINSIDDKLSNESVSLSLNFINKQTI